MCFVRCMSCGAVWCRRGFVCVSVFVSVYFVSVSASVSVSVFVLPFCHVVVFRRERGKALIFPLRETCPISLSLGGRPIGPSAVNLEGDFDSYEPMGCVQVPECHDVHVDVCICTHTPLTRPRNLVSWSQYEPR